MSSFTLNANTDITQNPYTPANINILLNNFKNVNGTGMTSAVNGNDNKAVHNATYGTLIQSSIIIGAVSSGDIIAACVLAKSGANVANGYQYYVNGTFARLALINATSPDISGTTFNFTPNVGDNVCVIFNTTNGVLQGLINGVVQSNTANVTYSSETSLAAGFALSAGNVNGSVIRIFQGNGIISSSPFMIRLYANNSAIVHRMVETTTGFKICANGDIQSNSFIEV